MKTQKSRIGLLSVLFLLFSCNVVVNPAGEVSNLVKNGSFEENGKPSLKYWFGADSSLAKFVKDTPERGGTWSVAVPAHHFGAFELRLAQTVKLQPGTHILQFSFWAKMKGIIALASLIRKTNDDKLVQECSVDIKDLGWHQYTLLDTVQLRSGETLYVNLSGGGTEIVAGETDFDLVSLTEVNKSK